MTDARRVLFLLLLLIGCAEPDPPEPLDRPTPGRWNVLLLVMDTTRADRVSTGGYGRPTTPSLSKFAREAVVYTNAWSPAPWTAPAHASLFTGLRPEHHGLHNNGRLWLDDSPQTLAEIFRAAGYATSCLSNNGFITPQFGLTRGFDHVETVSELHEPTAAWAHRSALEQARGARREGRPFFIFVNDIEPHLPYTPPSEFAADFLPDGTDQEAVSRAEAIDGLEIFEYLTGYREIDPAQWAVLSALYDAEIASLDREIGRLLSSLRDEGFLERTLVVITSDHGENLGEHGLAGHYFSLHRTLLHIPLLIRFPDGWRAGSQVEGVVRLEDLFPTILRTCELEAPDTDGTAIEGNLGTRIALGYYGKPPIEKLKALHSRPGSERFEAAIRSVYDGRYHLLRYSDGREELFDIRSDPLETRNLAGEMPEIVTRLARLIPE